LQLDIRNDFMRIDKAILWRLLAPHIPDDDARWLTELLVFHDCTEGHILKCAPEEIGRVPAHKTLLRCEPGKGLPIGNLNSQFFAHVYLNGLDQFVKHRVHCRHYIRYCDDFVLLSSDPYAMPKGLTAARQQYAWVRGAYPGDAVLFQVGAYYELYDRGDAPLAARLGLKPLEPNGRPALYGMPERLFGRYLTRLLGLGRAVLVVRQGEQHWTGIRERVVPAA
jgi:hypothetical protein